MTTFQAPLKVNGPNGDTGNPQTEQSGFIASFKVVSLNGERKRDVVTLPPNSSLLRCGAFVTSALASDVSALSISFGTSADATRYAAFSVSGVGALRSFTGAALASVVSGAADFDAVNTIVISASAVSTTQYTVGGARAFVEFLSVGT